jgi:hypothetical protein
VSAGQRTPWLEIVVLFTAVVLFMLWDLADCVMAQWRARK